MYRDSDIYVLAPDELAKIKAEQALREENDDVPAVNTAGFIQCPEVASECVFTSMRQHIHFLLSSINTRAIS